MNYGLSLSQSQSDQREAIQVFESLLGATPKGAEFFVNYSFALLRNQDSEKAESVARDGLLAYPNDRDLLGNLTNALLLQSRLQEALEISKIRLGFGRDLHALEEAGNVLQQMGDGQGDDWPKAGEYYKAALAYFEEAKEINPRYIIVRVATAIVFRKLHRFGDASDEVQAIRQFAENRSQYETGAILEAELLADVKAYRECLEFCNEWIPTLTIPNNKAWMEGIRTRALALQKSTQQR